MDNKHIENKLKLLPKLPGCYMMKNNQNLIIYIGKAKNLYNRVKSYFKSSHKGKTAQLVSEIHDFETIVTSTDKEAFLLEITLIKKYKPYYNIRLKEGMGYPYIKITNEKNPQLKLVRNIKSDGAYYFGPYPNIGAANKTLQLLQRTYPLRRCGGYQGKPCLYYHMGQCLGACFRHISREIYDKQINEIRSFLNGNVINIKNKLNTQMMVASNNMQYERAAELRDQIKYIEMTVEKQKIIYNDSITRDIIAFYVDKGWMSIQIFFIRQSRLIRREKKILPCIGDNETQFVSFIIQFYNRSKDITLPEEIIISSNVNENILKDILNIKIVTPKKGIKFKILEMARENAKLFLKEKFRLRELENDKSINAIKGLKKILNIKCASRIEVFDHSYLYGTFPVSSMVCFINGHPEKKEYRKYKLRSNNSSNEYLNTQEVIFRRYNYLLKEKLSLPDLILIDGGIIQVNAVNNVLNKKLKIHIPVAGIVKDEYHRTSDLINSYGEKIYLDKKSDVFYFLQRVQDEVHNFTINFHRQIRSKNLLSSYLEKIPGVGPKTRIKLLKNFHSLKNISNASISDIKSIGISDKLAQLIKISTQSY